MACSTYTLSARMAMSTGTFRQAVWMAAASTIRFGRGLQHTRPASLRKWTRTLLRPNNNGCRVTQEGCGMKRTAQKPPLTDTPAGTMQDVARLIDATIGEQLDKGVRD